jgi:hypothetical protein
MTSIVCPRQCPAGRLPLFLAEAFDAHDCRTRLSPGARYDEIAHKIASRYQHGSRTYGQGQRDIKNLNCAYRAYIQLNGGIRLFKRLQ